MNEQAAQYEQDVDHVDAGGAESLPGDPEAEKADAGSKGGLIIDELARLPERSLLDEAALARILHIAPRTLRRLVTRWQLPPGVNVGGRTYWFSGKVLDHIQAAADRAAKDAERNARKFRENFT